MSVAGQILENLLGTAKGRLHKGDPFDPPCLLAQGFERGRLRESGHLAMKLQSAGLECFPQINQEQIPKAAAQNLDREKERRFLASNPAKAVGTDAAAGNDTMQMRMQMQILSPCVQHSKKADICPQALSVGRDGEQRLRCRAEQETVNLARIL